MGWGGGSGKANVNLKNALGQTPVDAVVRWKRQFDDKAGADSSSTLFAAALGAEAVAALRAHSFDEHTLRECADCGEILCCPGCGEPIKVKASYCDLCGGPGRRKRKYSLRLEPRCRSDACLKAGHAPGHRCAQCLQWRPADEYGARVRDGARADETWRCLQCQYPYCTHCGARRSQDLRPSRSTGAYVCEQCRERYTCSVCGESKSRQEYDATHLSHHLHHERALCCEDCKSKRDKQTYKCHRCDGQYFPREHFHKTDLNIFCSVRRWS